MSSLAAALQAECDDNMGAGAARAAAEALAAAARAVENLAGTGIPALMAGALVRLNEATVDVERLYERQLCGAVIREAGYAEGYAAGLAARGLRAVR